MIVPIGNWIAMEASLSLGLRRLAAASSSSSSSVEVVCGGGVRLGEFGFVAGFRWMTEQR